MPFHVVNAAKLINWVLSWCFSCRFEDPFPAINQALCHRYTVGSFGRIPSGVLEGCARLERSLFLCVLFLFGWLIG